MTTNSAAVLLALLSVTGCAPDGRSSGRPAPLARSVEAAPCPPMPASELARLFEAARRDAATEMIEVFLALPPDSREFEARWVIDRGSAAQAARVIEALELREIAPLEASLLRRARGPDPASRDPAVLALAAAGVADVQPVIAHALRTEASESSLAGLARAAARLGPFLPVEALKTALARARTGPALAEITAALGTALDAEALRILASRGAAAGPALELALRLLRGNAGRIPGAPPPEPALRAVRGSRPAEGGVRSGPGPEAVALLRSRAAGIAEADAHRERALTAWLGKKLAARAPDAAAAAGALGRLGSPMAATELVRGFRNADREVAAAISSALAVALRVVPAKTPRHPDELRRAWFPILATLFPDENAHPSDRL